MEKEQDEDPPKEREEAEQRSAPTAHVVHAAIRREGEEELKRRPSALFWSGLAAGLSMGFSLIAEGLLRSHLPDAEWRPLVAKLGYPIGFLVVVLGRQQLFTENTLTVILPLLHGRDRTVLLKAARLWGIVLLANLVGALAFAWVCGKTGVFDAPVKEAFAAMALEHGAAPFGTVLLRGIFAGWLIALMVWLMPAAETARVAVIVIVTWVIGVGGFAHVIAGSIEQMYAAVVGQDTWTHYLWGFLVPALIGNVLGGTALVAALNHAAVAAGREA